MPEVLNKILNLHEIQQNLFIRYILLNTCIQLFYRFSNKISCLVHVVQKVKRNTLNFLIQLWEVNALFIQRNLNSCCFHFSLYLPVLRQRVLQRRCISAWPPICPRAVWIYWQVSQDSGTDQTEKYS